MSYSLGLMFGNVRGDDFFVWPIVPEHFFAYFIYILLYFGHDIYYDTYLYTDTYLLISDTFLVYILYTVSYRDDR